MIKWRSNEGQMKDWKIIATSIALSHWRYTFTNLQEHIPGTSTGNEADILTIFATYRDIIALDPPQRFFPENITRLVARDPTLQPGKLSCKEAMWWDGIELVPPRPKLGLLGILSVIICCKLPHIFQTITLWGAGKIWGGSGLRRPCQAPDAQKSRKLRQQASQATDASSPCSSATESDDDDTATACGESSVDEDSDNSEESRAWPSHKRTGKAKRNSRYYAPKRYT